MLGKENRCYNTNPQNHIHKMTWVGFRFVRLAMTEMTAARIAPQRFSLPLSASFSPPYRTLSFPVVLNGVRYNGRSRQVAQSNRR